MDWTIREKGLTSFKLDTPPGATRASVLPLLVRFLASQAHFDPGQAQRQQLQDHENVVQLLDVQFRSMTQPGRLQSLGRKPRRVPSV